MPFWLAVEPMVSTKRPRAAAGASFSSATLSAVGSVALEEAVEKAVTIASWMPRKKRRGLMPPSSRTASE